MAPRRRGRRPRRGLRRLRLRRGRRGRRRDDTAASGDDRGALACTGRGRRGRGRHVRPSGRREPRLVPRRRQAGTARRAPDRTRVARPGAAAGAVRRRRRRAWSRSACRAATTRTSAASTSRPIKTPTPGKYWLLAEPVGGRKIQALGNVVVERKSAAPAVGEHAIASKTPTLASTGGDLAALTTSRHPDRALYRTSVAEALAAQEPVRGRVRDTAVLPDAHVRARRSTSCPLSRKAQPADSGVAFIHVEIYADNDPAKGVNRWVAQWRLPTEPFTFVVDRTGVIRTKLEGAFSADELERAVAAVADPAAARPDMSVRTPDTNGVRHRLCQARAVPIRADRSTGCAG